MSEPEYLLSFDMGLLDGKPIGVYRMGRYEQNEIEIWRGGDSWERVAVTWDMPREIETADNKYFTPLENQSQIDALIAGQSAFGWQLVIEGLKRIFYMRKLKLRKTELENFS